MEDRRPGPEPSPECLNACTDGDLNYLRQLLQDQEVATTTLAHLLDEAARNKHTHIIHFLFETYPDLEPDSRTAFRAACAGLSVYRLIHSRLPDIIHVNFGEFGDAVSVAVRRTNVPLLKYLLEHGADPGRAPNADTPRFLYRLLPVEAAALSCTIPVTSQLLVEYGATLEHTTALAIAAGLGRIEIVRYLLDAGADIDYVYNGDPLFEPNAGHGAPLHSAVRSRHVDIARLLLHRGARIDNLNSDGQTPVDIASGKADAELLSVLQGRG